MKRIGWNFRKKPPNPLNRSTTEGERDQVHKIFILQSQSKEASTRWFTSVKSRPLDTLVFFTAIWIKNFFQFSSEIFRQFLPYQRVCWRNVCNFGKKNWQKKTDFSENEGSRIYLLILTGGTDLDRSRVVCYCPSMIIKNDVRVLLRLNYIPSNVKRCSFL